MSNQGNPAIDRYLTRLSKELADLPEPERTEVIGEIRSHAAEAMQAGAEPAAVLERFGDPRQLAAAYRVELALQGSGWWQQASGWRLPGSGRRLRGVGRFFAVLGVTAVTSLMSFIVIVVLGALTLAFTGGGVAAIVAGALSLLLPGTFIESTLAIPQTISELLAIGAGVALSFLGFISAIALFFYVRIVVRSFRRTVRNLRGGGEAT